MGERFVIADDDADAAAMPCGGGEQRAFEAGVARTEDRQPSAPLNDAVDDCGQNVHALLPGQPADDADDRAVVVLEIEAVLDGLAIEAAGLQCLGRVIGHQMLVGRRVPDIGVDAVDDAVEVDGAHVYQAVEAHAELRRADFLRVGRAHRGDRPGCLQACLEKADAAIIFDAVELHGHARQAELAEDAGAELALEGKIVHGDQRRHADRLAVAHVSQRHRRLQVMGVHDVGLVAGDRPAGDVSADLAQRREAPPVVGPVGT